MKKVFFLFPLLVCSLCAQTELGRIKIFGYYQNSFAQQDSVGSGPSTNTFNVDQLNIFFQSDLSETWTAFVNLEMFNSYSSINNWGGFNLEEAWVKYRNCEKFTIKFGLQIPVFNHLNEIKNRTPLLPYVWRPFVYEKSLSEVISFEEFTPSRAFIQAYGYFSIHPVKIDWAAYLGNSPNISTVSGDKQSGIDTTDTFLGGGRIGVRTNDIKCGISYSQDRVREEYTMLLENRQLLTFDDLLRRRFGADFSFQARKIGFESEWIRVIYDEDHTEFDINKHFSYVTLSYRFNEDLLSYVSLWDTEEHFKPWGEIDYAAQSIGASYMFSDRITFKSQFTKIEFDLEGGFENTYQDFYVFALAASVWF